MPKTTTILFDCDNTLVKSESIAFEACATIANGILGRNGVDRKYTGPDLQADFVGQNFRGMLNGLIKRHNLTIGDDVVDKAVASELDMVIKSLRETPVELCDGVQEALDDVASKPGPNGKYVLSVVSSSAMSRIQAALEVVKIDKYFGNRLYSAATSLPVPTSKPKPDIYLHACRALGKRPDECVAIEDSRSGATAAVAAGIPLIGYVGVYDDPKEKQEVEAMFEELGAIVIMQDWADFRECLKKVEEAPAPAPKI